MADEKRRAQFGMIGLGVMGANLALNVEERGFPIAVWNYETDWIERFVRENPSCAIVPSPTLEDLAGNVERPRRIMMMIKAGAPVDMTLERLAPLLDEGDVVIDGGNSWFRDTERRQEELRKRGIHFVGCGVSGGEEGARRGPSLMPGGEWTAWEVIAPVLEAIAARSDSGPCVTWVGAGGSGHFVKMVHNGIEYGVMQLIAEVYDFLKTAGEMEAGDLAVLFEAWNQGELASFLVEITAEIFRVRDPESGRPLVDLVLDQAEQKGTGRWTAQVALELAVPLPTIAAAIDARVLSSMKEERLQASRRLPAPSSQPAKLARNEVAAIAHDALLASMICAYAQGMDLIAKASAEYGWGVSLAEIARIWKAGCIIRAAMLDPIMQAFRSDEQLRNLILDASFSSILRRRERGWRRTAALAQTAGVPVPALAASLAWFDSWRSARLPQNLTQAQRDYFGAHTYRRIDQPEKGAVHSEWGKK